MDSLFVVLGDQLFLPPAGSHHFFLREDPELAQDVRHHQQKLILFFSAMRHWAREREDEGHQVTYQEWGKALGSYAEAVICECRRLGLSKVKSWVVNDRPFALRLREDLEGAGIDWSEEGQPGFLTSSAEWQSYRASSKRLLMGDFYIRQRKRLSLLVDSDGKPEGGQWSYDPENRKALPKGLVAPFVPRYPPDSLTNEVIGMVQRDFADHPGDGSLFDWPVTRPEALAEL
nr:cryptochrome/photolyase family protein [Fimbriimonadaceae bacterium]